MPLSAYAKQVIQHSSFSTHSHLQVLCSITNLIRSEDLFYTLRLLVDYRVDYKWALSESKNSASPQYAYHLLKWRPEQTTNFHLCFGKAVHFDIAMDV